jgi:hypothetical protein
MTLHIHNLGFGKCFVVDVMSKPLYFSGRLGFEASVFGNESFAPTGFPTSDRQSFMKSYRNW